MCRSTYVLKVILWDELGRAGGGVLGQVSINSMALPPLINFASEKLQGLVVQD